MYSVYKTQALTGVVGPAVIIVCTGEYNTVRFAEYHILLPSHRAPSRRFSWRLQSDAGDEALGISLADLVLSFATDKVQSLADEQVLEPSNKLVLAPPVVVSPTTDSALRQLHYAGLCEQELNAIAASTLSPELKGALRRLQVLPPIWSSALS